MFYSNNQYYQQQQYRPPYKTYSPVDIQTILNNQLGDIIDEMLNRKVEKVEKVDKKRKTIRELEEQNVNSQKSIETLAIEYYK